MSYLRPFTITTWRVRGMLALVVALACGSAPASARGQEMEVPVALQLPLFLKVLSFDRQLVARAGSALVIAIVYQSGYRTSGQAKEELVRTAGSAGALPRIEGLAIRFVEVDLYRETLADAIERSRPTVVYLAPVRGVDIKALAATARAAHVTTVTGVPRYVEQGLAIGVRLRGERPQILVNLMASRSEGAEFAAELLKLVQLL
jgi:hypothetical protein